MNRPPNRAHPLRVPAGLALAAGLGVLAVARGAGAEAHRPPPPPPEAFAACEGKARGDACSVQFDDQTIAGTCDAPPDASRLACRPNTPPCPPPGAGDR